MRVIEVPAGQNLAPFSEFLRRHRVAHRIFEERGLQIVELADASAAADVKRAFAAWQSGDLQLDNPPRQWAESPRGPGIVASLRAAPGVLLVVLVAIAMFPFAMGLISGRPNAVVLALTIVDLRVHGEVSFAVLLGDLAPWRWLTPIFLHFSVLHLLFNSVVTFELGRRIESAQGTGWFLLVVLFTSLISNFGQVFMNDNPLFGGLSGMAYGLLGYLLVMARRAPQDPRWQLPKGLAISLLIFLVVFSTGITEPFGLHVANAAHWSGLICGALLALLPGVDSAGRVSA